jgi:uncharacterized protein (TIGR02757 family)
MPRPSVPAFSKAQAALLKPRLDAFLEQTAFRERIGFDPVELPHRYRQRDDIEVAALVSACLAYGRADLFKPKLEQLFAGMGQSPASFVGSLDLKRTRRLLDGFVYRFNVGTDLAALLWGMKWALRKHGSLEALFLAGLTRDEDGSPIRAALSAFTAALRGAAPMKTLRRELGRERGLHHLLPAPLGPGAAKRLNLFLRWMSRGPDEVDFGLWKGLPPSRLMIPLDTHIGRIAQHLGLTRRKDLTWKTAEEITRALRLLDADDPVRYDFALCHYGMSGVCPTKPVPAHCTVCLLLPACQRGQADLAPKGTG